MKRTAMQHTKLKRLMKALDCPQYVAVGILESLWHLTARETPIGNIGKLSNDDIALQIDWREEPDSLVQGLLASGWLDIDEDHRLRVHDWMEHCDDATKKHLERSGLLNGKTAGPWIYFIRGTTNGLIKIGFTEGSVESRIKALQTGCPERLEIVGSVRGTRNLEIDLHKRFAAHRQTGEWFSPADELLRHISDATGVVCLPLSDNGVLPEPLPLPKPEPEEQKQQPSETPAGARSKKPKSSSEVDPRHQEFRLAFRAYFLHKNPALTQEPWDAQEASQLSRFLKKNPNFTTEQWKLLLTHRARSAVLHGENLSAWIGRGLNWTAGPTDRFGNQVSGGFNASGKPTEQQIIDSGADVLAARRAGRMADEQDRVGRALEAGGAGFGSHSQGSAAGFVLRAV